MVEAPAVAGQAAVLADDAMARDEGRDRARGAGDGAERARGPELGGEIVFTNAVRAILAREGRSSP